MKINKKNELTTGTLAKTAHQNAKIICITIFME